MILVTGASGFLGQHLLRFLSAQGSQVRALYNSHPPTDELLSLPGVSWASYDLLDVFAVEEALLGITNIYHCAAMVSFDPRNRAAMLHFNAESTANIVNQALEQGIRKMVHVSSVAALGRTEHEREITEEEEWEESRQNSAYGMSKYLAEMEVWRGISEGLNAAVINPGIILGPGNWDKGSARLMKVVYNQFPFYTEGVTAWVDVTDVVKAMHTLMNSDIAAERFILSAGNFAYKDIFTRMALALNRRPPYIKANGLMTGLVWRWNAFKTRIGGGKSSITKETASNARHKSYYNNEKLLKQFPAFSYTAIDETIHRMAQSFMHDMNKK